MTQRPFRFRGDWNANVPPVTLYQAEQPRQNKAGANGRQTHSNGSKSSSRGIDFKRTSYTNTTAGAT